MGFVVEVRSNRYSGLWRELVTHAPVGELADINRRLGWQKYRVVPAVSHVILIGAAL